MKRVLLAVCGLTPQVITETLYALHREGRMVDAVRVLTTRAGKGVINAHLLQPEGGEYYRFMNDYGIDVGTVDFAHRHVITAADEYGTEMDDIGTEEESELFLRYCMELAFELTLDPDASVYFSIAGGRKTMGASLALAAQCYGRPQDRIFHVLVSPEFESSRDFFYPPPVSRLVTLHDQLRQPYQKETRYARISLVSMPFFPVRDRLSDRMLREAETPTALMMSLVKEARQDLMIDLRARTVTWKGVQCDMMPAHLALYVFFALFKKERDCSRSGCRGCDECFLSAVDVLDHQEQITGLYKKICSSRCVEEMSDGGVCSLSSENFNSYRSKIKRILEQGFGAHELKHLEIASVGRRPGVRYGISLDRARIRIVI